MTTLKRLERAATFPSRKPVYISANAWYYESRKSILLITEGAQTRITISQMERFLKRAAHARKGKQRENMGR